MPTRERTEVGALYYRVVKMYELPIRNHTHVSLKITALMEDIGPFRAKHYLATLLRRDIRTEAGDYKPVLTESLDIYTKRLKVERWLTDHKPQKVWRPPTPEELAAAEAVRQRQFED